MLDLLWVALSAAAWCFLHSWFIALLRPGRLLRPAGFPQAASRLTYVAGSTLTLAGLLLWWRSLPALTWFTWHGAWQIVRWAGLGAAALLFLAGARVYDNAYFLGLRQLRDCWRGRVTPPPPLRRRGILAHMRHPYYAGSFLFLVCCLPLTDVNLVWRIVFLVYTYVGTRL
jgi:hypothetical protein